MSWINILLPPLIGGIIGAVTNDMAIKMLFRPYKPIFVGKFKVPFTPGIVPKHMDFLAEALGREVVNRFFNADDLIILFQSDDFSDTVSEAITDALLAKKTTLCLEMEKLERREDTGSAINNIKKQICEYISDALSHYNFAPAINSVCKDVCNGKYSSKIPLGLKNNYATFSPFVSEAMNNYFKNNGEELLFKEIDEVLVEFGDRPINTIISSLISQRDILRAMIKRVYIRFMGTYVRDIVSGIDIAGMITEKFRLMEPEGIEKLVVSIVKRELNYVVLLGGVLGMVIGTINIFF